MCQRSFLFPLLSLYLFSSIPLTPPQTWRKSKCFVKWQFPFSQMHEFSFMRLKWFYYKTNHFSLFKFSFNNFVIMILMLMMMMIVTCMTSFEREAPNNMSKKFCGFTKTKQWVIHIMLIYSKWLNLDKKKIKNIWVNE